MSRYKKIKMNSFSGGGEQVFFKDQKSFSRSYKMNLNRKTDGIVLASKLGNNTIAGFFNSASGVEQKPLFTEFNNFNFALVLDQSTSVPKLFKSEGTGTFSLVYTFSTQNGLDEIHLCQAFGDVLIVGFWDDAQSKIVFYSSKDAGASWSVIDSLPNESPVGVKIINKKIHVFFKKSIYISSDGLFFLKTALEIPNNFNIFSAEFFENFIYLILKSQGGTYSEELGRIENDEFVSIKKISEANFLIASKNLLYISTTKAKIYSFDGDEVKQRFDLKNYFNDFANFTVNFAEDDRVYFSIHFVDSVDGLEHCAVFSIIGDEGIFLEYYLPANEFINFISYQKEFLFIGTSLINDLTAKIYFRDSIKKYEPTGYIESSIIDEGELVPKQLILKHKPLEAGTSVKVYVKKDRASSWGNAILTSDTAGSIKKKYAFPSGLIFDFLEFKLELITSDETKSPEDAQFEFFYMPIGLENAK